MPVHKFILNGEPVSVECDNDVRLLWVLRDLLGVHGPKYGCGLEVCRACTSHINGKAFNPCGVPGGAGELGVAPAMAAVACAYARATGTLPTRFPINHDAPLGFDPQPTIPPIPQSPTDGLQHVS